MAPSKRQTLHAAISECGCEKDKLRNLAREIVAGLSETTASGGEAPLDIFIAELVLSAADQRRRVERRQRQAEGIAAAKARGVRFGRQPKTLPDDFDEYCQAWRDGSLTLREAAESCGMGRSTFYSAAQRKEQDGEFAV